MKQLLILAISIVLHQYITAQTFNMQWALSVGSSSVEVSNCIKTDAANNLYVTGYYRGTVDFDPGVTTYTLSSALEDIFIAKYDSNGNLVWANSIGGSQYDSGISLALDNAGNIYVTGRFQGVADFDPSVATTTLNASGGGSYDMFVAKYDNAGTFIWAKQISGTATESPFSIAIDNLLNVNICGNFSGTADFDPSIIVNSYSATTLDMFILQLNNTGDLNWVNVFGANNNESFNAIAYDTNNNIIVTGNFGSTVDFDPSVATATLSSVGQDEIVVAKYANNGAYIWAKKAGGSVAGESGSAVAVDNLGDIYVGGIYGAGSIYFTPTLSLTTQNFYNNGFIARYSSTGACIWAASIGSNFCTGLNLNSISADNSGSIYIAGNYTGKIQFPNFGNYITSEGMYDLYFAKYDGANGNYIDHVTYGSSGDDQINSIAVNNTGDIYITGYMSNTLDADPSSNLYNLTSNGGFDILIAKYNLATATSLQSSPINKNAPDIYPNPATNHISLTSSKEIGVVKIRDMFGKTILVSTIETSEATINVSDLSAGIYFVSVNSNNNASTYKIIKQ